MFCFYTFLGKTKGERSSQSTHAQLWDISGDNQEKCSEGDIITVPKRSSLIMNNSCAKYTTVGEVNLEQKQIR
jgi:hypothetical protein